MKTRNEKFSFNGALCRMAEKAQGHCHLKNYRGWNLKNKQVDWRAEVECSGQEQTRRRKLLGKVK